MSDQRTAARALEDEAAMWKYLHDLFRSPGEAQWRWLHEESTRRAFELLTATALRLPTTSAEFEQEYLAAFEVGLPHATAPLLESHWKRTEPTPRVLHQNLLFYRRFGLELRQPSADSADHLRLQLELMCHLCRLQTRAVTAGKHDEAAQLARACREFAEQHLAWVSLAAAAIERVAPASWPSAWLALLASCCKPPTEEVNRCEP